MFVKKGKRETGERIYGKEGEALSGWSGGMRSRRLTKFFGRMENYYYFWGV